MLLSEDQISSALKKALPNLPTSEIQKATAALIVAGREWQEVNLKEMFGASISIQCKDICVLGEAYDKGQKIRAFIKKE